MNVPWIPKPSLAVKSNTFQEPPLKSTATFSKSSNKKKFKSIPTPKPKFNHNQHKRRQQSNSPQCHRSLTILLWHPTRRGGPTNPLIHGTFIEIYGSFIYIYDHFQREAQIHLWTFMASFMIIFDPKKARSAKHLWLIDDHFWLKKQIFNSM